MPPKPKKPTVDEMREAAMRQHNKQFGPQPAPKVNRDQRVSVRTVSGGGFETNRRKH
jgi:hypothetical protein